MPLLQLLLLLRIIVVAVAFVVAVAAAVWRSTGLAWSCCNRMDIVIPKLSATPTLPLEVTANTSGRTSAAAAAVAHVEAENGARYPPRREGGLLDTDFTAKN